MNSLQNVPPRRALATMRIIWGAIILGQLVFLAVLILVIMPKQQPHPAQPVLVWMNLILLVTAVPMTFGLRQLAFRKTQVEGRIPAAVYSRANLIFWAGCESVSFFGMVVAMLNDTLWPTIVVVIIAMVLQVLTFPVGAKILTQ